MMHHRGADFLRVRRRRRYLWGSIGACIAVVVLIVLLFRGPAFAAATNALTGKTHFTAVQTALEHEDFAKAADEASQAVDAFTRSQKEIKRLRLLKVIPGVHRQITAVENLLQVGVQAGKAAQTLAAVAERITEPLRKDGDVTFATISAAEKRSILELVSQSEPEIQGAKASIDLAALYLGHIPERGLLPPIAAAIAPIREKLPTLQASLMQAVPAVRVLPSFAGYPQQKTYLFLLENNNELRPTGGFIGTYGILKVKDGEVVSLSTDNIYNLDAKAEDFLRIDPPEPLKKYLDSQRWFLRDANWSPDFPTSALQVLSMFDQEKQAPQHLDGIIAITPTFVQSLMRLTGPISTDGVTFTSDNVVDQLQYQVEVAFVRKGITDANRKDIIGDMSAMLFERLLALPKTKWGELATTLGAMTKEKHLLLYTGDNETEALIASNGWGGEVRTPQGDGFFVVDANLASLKTDQTMERSITYSVAPEGNDLLATLAITYNHRGNFDWKTTRYRTYTRVYVPDGSTLLDHQGYLQNDKLHGAKPGDVETWNELGKTVFGGFTSIEPQTQGTLTLRYKLPQAIADAYQKGSYELLAQKQAGTIAHGLTLDVLTQGRIQSYSPQEGVTVDGRHLKFAGDLREDRAFSLVFRP